MREGPLIHAREGDEQDFRELTEPYRRELLLHCYRMLGSLQDAEDALQETLVAAWRGLEGFEGRASLRSWLYRIATNRCLNERRDKARRPQAAALPFEPTAPTRLSELSWLEPYPDAWLEGVPDSRPGPDARYETREAVGLAFITALQRLPERQRAVLVLRDVLGFRAAEAAQMLETSEATVNSALLRARSALEARMPSYERVSTPSSERERELADSFADAFERGDMDRIVALLTDDAWVRMPPQPFEYQGRTKISEFLHHVAARRRAGGVTLLVPTRANGQPAFGHYMRGSSESVAVGTGVFVLDLEGDAIATITRFGGDHLLTPFGLPEVLAD